MEKINFIKNGTSLILDEGVRSENFYSNIPLGSNASNVRSLFESYGYDLNGIPGSFVKIFTANEKETAEIAESLAEIEKMGLKDIFANNYALAHFRRAFVARTKEALEMGIPFLNSDNTFIRELNSNESFNAYIERTPKKSDVNHYQNNFEQDEILEARIASMDEFETNIYNSIAEKLNYLILANATNYNLVSILKLAIRKFAEAIINKDYELAKDEMLERVISAIGIDAESPEAELILSAVADMKISVERGRA